MAPIILPASQPILSPPQSPQDPPSHQNIIEAIQYARRAELAYNVQKVDATILSEAVMYQSKLVMAKITNDDVEAIAPAWLQPALNQVRVEIQGSLNTIQGSIDTLRSEVNQRLISIEQTCAINHNMAATDGQILNFKRVPFADGTDPVINHNLPPINTTADVQDLTDDALRTYYIHYVGPVGNRLRETQIKGVRKAIGATQ